MNSNGYVAKHMYFLNIIKVVFLFFIIATIVIKEIVAIFLLFHILLRAPLVNSEHKEIGEQKLAQI